MSQVKPFKIDIPQARLNRLKQKLAAVDFPPEIEGAGWAYGAPLADIKRLTKYWHESFDWRKAEAELNELPQFTTRIELDGFDPIDLHFVHAKSPNPNAIPLLFCHGWPGSFDEVTKLLPLLLDGGKDHPSFDVIAPSMPNYGFSSRVHQPAFGTVKTAEVFQKLMVDVLGYPQYVTQGGDIGYAVSRWLGFLYPESCKANHYNFCMPGEPKEDEFPELAKTYKETPRTQAELDGFARTQWFVKEGQGYSREHSTKPQTLGYSLTDSPVGLLAWIYEKLHDWTDDYPWTDYEVCKWISIYWFSIPGPLASIWIYYDGEHSTEDLRKSLGRYLKGVKLGFTRFPKELVVVPSLWYKTLGDAVFIKEYDHGGHFAAVEHPNELASDLREMYGKNGGAAAVVPGKSGYA